MDWLDWHRDYEDDTPLARRLILVQAHIEALLPKNADAPFNIVSMCAGDGRDILGVLERHPAASCARTWLIELDPELAGRARKRSAESGLDVNVVVTDAGRSDAYVGAAPANLLLACGVFGNVSDADVEATIRGLPMLLAPRASVIWTRHRHEPDLTGAIRAWFADSGFVERSFEVVPDSIATVGVHRLTRPPRPIRPGRRLFDFIRER